MKFLLLENDNINLDLGITPQLIDEFNNADTRRKDTIVHVIMNKMKDPSINKLSNAFRKSCFDLGIDTNRNPFILLISDLGSYAKVDKSHDGHVCALIDLYLQGFVPKRDLFKHSKNSFILQPSLYHRNLEEFVYTVKAFDIASNPTKLSKYFNDTSSISVDDLYDKSGKIKPAGSPSTANDTNTIFGTVESWGGADGENNKTVGKRSGKNDSHDELTQREKKRIKDSMGNETVFLDDIKNPKVGKTVFVYGKKRPKGIAYDPSDPYAGYYKYTSSGWVKLADAWN